MVLCRVEELELTITTREDVISHLNKDVEKLLAEMRSLGELKLAGEQQAKDQLTELARQTDQLSRDKQAAQDRAASLQGALEQQQQGSFAFCWSQLGPDSCRSAF